jgi:hypothetical protein
MQPFSLDIALLLLPSVAVVLAFAGMLLLSRYRS